MIVKGIGYSSFVPRPDLAAHQNSNQPTTLHMAVRLMDSVVEKTVAVIGDGSGTGVTVNSMQVVVESPSCLSRCRD
jgi:hypothetical protein